MLKKLLMLMAASAGLVFTGLVGGTLYLRSAEPDYDARVTVPGLDAEVLVLRDSLAVPHIWAGSLEDLAFAQGYAHAQDRLWQMELLRRVAEGRLSEVMGERLVESDKLFRTLGFWRAAGRKLAAYDDETRGVLEAYAAGVNAYLAHRQGALPPEFVVLGIEPEPWTARHSAAVEMVMAFDLAAYGAGIRLSRAIRELGPERAAPLFPHYPAWGDVIVPPSPPALPAVAASLLDALSSVRASNAWVIDGSRTASGKPILANDMHLAMRAPALWHLMALHGRGIDVAGMTIPGAPGVVAGHNRAIAWGYTNAYTDDVDLFIERPDPADPTRYLTPDGSEPFGVIVDTIHVKDRDEPVVFTIRTTRHGPVLSDVEPELGEDVVALRWAAHDPSDTFEALLAFNRAEDWDDFVRAVASFDNPHQNVVYADTAGRIGYWMGGRVPLRAGGQRPPVAPVPGWTGEWDWTGELPFQRHPHVLEPESGYIVTANNRQIHGPVGDIISSEWAPPFRAMRIRELIEGAEAPLDAAAVHAQQMDVGDPYAARYVDRAIAAARAAGLEEEAALLEAWDLRASADSRAAALFYAFRQELRDEVARAIYGEAGGWLPDWTLQRALERRALPGTANEGDEAFAAAAAAAMLRADSIAAGRPWGELHRRHQPHALASVEALDDLFRLSLEPEPAGGSPYTVNVSHWGGSLPALSSHAASQRHVVDMADVDGGGGFIIPTGQSGVPFSPHYRDQYERWLEGGLWRIPLGREESEARAMYRTVLEPES